MDLLTFEEAQRAFNLVITILDSVRDGSDVVVTSRDAEVVALGLVLALRKSRHAPHFPEVKTWFE